MKKIIISVLSFLCMCFGPLVAQEVDKVLMVINYEFIHVYDTNNRESPYKEEMSVYMGQNSSVYKNRELGAMKEERKLALGKNYNRFDFQMNGYNISQEELYFFPIKRRALWIDPVSSVRTKFLVELDFPVLDWEIVDEIKDIGGYSCQKAMGRFGGRVYSAWFTTEIPVSYGPWKLHGLPGLILQAEDSKKEVLFNYKGFEKVGEMGMLINLPKNTVTTTLEKLINTKEQLIENEAYAVNYFGMSVKRTDSDGVISEEKFMKSKEDARRRRQENLKKRNNPVELNFKQAN